MYLRYTVGFRVITWCKVLKVPVQYFISSLTSFISSIGSPPQPWPFSTPYCPSPLFSNETTDHHSPSKPSTYTIFRSKSLTMQDTYYTNEKFGEGRVPNPLSPGGAMADPLSTHS